MTGEAERTGATEGGRLDGGVALILGLTTAGDPGPRSIRLSSVASFRTWEYNHDPKKLQIYYKHFKERSLAV